MRIGIEVVMSVRHTISANLSKRAHDDRRNYHSPVLRCRYTVGQDSQGQTRKVVSQRSCDDWHSICPQRRDGRSAPFVARWLKYDYNVLFGGLLDRSTLLRQLARQASLTDRLLAAVTFSCVTDNLTLHIVSASAWTQSEAVGV